MAGPRSRARTSPSDRSDSGWGLGVIDDKTRRLLGAALGLHLPAAGPLLLCASLKSTKITHTHAPAQTRRPASRPLAPPYAA